jgi:hypothetical protein
LIERTLAVGTRPVRQDMAHMTDLGRASEVLGIISDEGKEVLYQLPR